MVVAAASAMAPTDFGIWIFGHPGCGAKSRFAVIIFVPTCRKGLGLPLPCKYMVRRHPAGSPRISVWEFPRAYVSAGAKIGIIPVEKSAILGGRQPGLILDSEEGRMCSGGATWKRLLS